MFSNVLINYNIKLLYISINKISSGIFNLINVQKKTNVFINTLEKTLLDIDLEFNLQVIQSVITNDKYKNKNNKSIKIALSGIEDVMISIKKSLESINRKKMIDSKKWFSYWRSSDYENDINNIIEKSKILMKRFKIFIDLEKII